MAGRGRGRFNNSNMPPRDPAIKQERSADAPRPSMPWRPQFPVPVIEDIELCTRGKLSKFPGTGKCLLTYLVLKIPYSNFPQIFFYIKKKNLCFSIF